MAGNSYIFDSSVISRFANRFSKYKFSRVTTKFTTLIPIHSLDQTELQSRPISNLAYDIS